MLYKASKNLHPVIYIFTNDEKEYLVIIYENGSKMKLKKGAYEINNTLLPVEKEVLLTAKNKLIRNYYYRICSY